MPNDVKAPDVTVELTGHDGNAFSIMGRVSKALIAAGLPDLARQYLVDAQTGDYDHLLQVTMQYVNVE